MSCKLRSIATEWRQAGPTGTRVAVLVIAGEMSRGKTRTQMRACEINTGESTNLRAGQLPPASPLDAKQADKTLRIRNDE